MAGPSLWAPHMSREAWFCPSCQKHHAPHVETCPGGTGGFKLPIFSSAATPLETRAQCSRCGMVFEGVMGWVCPRSDCPTRASSCGGVTFRTDGENTEAVQ